MEPDDDKTQAHSLLTKGTMVSHYRIIQKIGAGGMGEVYLAEDTELDRKVALKFLPPHLCQDEDCRARFKREAQAAAKLNHPNIIHVYEVSEHKGRPFFAMEHVEGRSLREHASGKELSVQQILELGIQICEGLNDAHEGGITHRDIKPSNILIDSHGRAKIVDFGLASVLGSDQLTKTGSTLGTIGYMSPEQVRGQEIDHRSDLFSLGVVLYELVTKQNPFKRDSEAATLKAVSDDAPEPLSRYKSGVSGELQRIISKLLEKDPALRYQSAAGVVSDIKRLTVQVPAAAGRPRKSRWFRYVVTGATAVLLVIVGYQLVSDRQDDATLPTEPERKMLAVLPFENLGAPEDEYFADGITDEIISRLAGLHGLGVISRTSSLQYKKTTKNIRQIGDELGVQYILEGTIRWDRSTEEGRVRVNPQLIRVSDDVHLWADRYDAVIDDIFAVQAEIAEKVVEELDITLLDSERQTLTEQPSENTEAYDYYLKGRKYFGNHTAKDYMNAEAMFQKAIELEPDFVSALAWLSIVHTQIYSWYLDRTDERLAAAKEAADRALEIGPDLATAHGALAWYHYAGVEDSEQALEEFTALRERQPSDAMFNFCIALIEERQGKWEEALVDYERAIKLDPRSATFCGEYGTALYCLRRYNEAESLYNRAIELKPDMRQPHVNKSLIYLYRDGDITGAKQVLQEALQMNDRWPDLTDREATLEALEGNYDRALTLLNDVRDISDIPAYDSACYYSLKGSIYRYMNQTDLMESCYDSARVILDRLVSAEAEDPWYHAELGMVLAGLGRKQEAMHHGRLAVELSETTENTSDRADLISYLADTYAIVGEYDLAIDQFDYLLSVPSQMSVPLMKIWPDYAPLRDHPRFQALIDKYEKIHGI